MSNYNKTDFLLHPNKNYIIKNFLQKKNLVEPFFEGPGGEKGEAGIRGLRGDRGIRGSEGPAGVSGPAGEGLTEADMISKTLWCVTDNQCNTPKNIIARYREDSLIKIGPNTQGNKSLVLGGKNNETGEAGMYTANGDLFIDAANADDENAEPGEVYIGSNSKGKTFINIDGTDTLLNDRSGFVGINMNTTIPENHLHIKGDRALTVENIDENAGSGGVRIKDARSNQFWTMGVSDIGFYLKDENKQKYSLITKDGSTAIGSDITNPKFSLLVEGESLYKNDIRLRGRDTSVQLNLNQFEGDKTNFTNLNQGVELMGGDPTTSKLIFYGNRLDVDYKNEKYDEYKPIVRFTKDGFEVAGPAIFEDTVNFNGNPSIEVNDIANFNGKAYFKNGSYWQDEDKTFYTQIEGNQLSTNNGIKLVSGAKSGEISYNENALLNNGEDVLGITTTQGAIVIQDNLIVEGKGNGGLKGIESDYIKVGKLEADSIRTTTAINYSDSKLKKNIKAINQVDNMNKLKKLKGYEYITRKTNKKDKGVIAQQVEKVDPQLVDNSGKYKGVKYNNIIPMLIEGIKYQQKQINELKKRIN